MKFHDFFLNSNRVLNPMNSLFSFTDNGLIQSLRRCDNYALRKYTGPKTRSNIFGFNSGMNRTAEAGSSGRGIDTDYKYSNFGSILNTNSKGSNFGGNKL